MTRAACIMKVGIDECGRDGSEVHFSTNTSRSTWGVEFSLDYRIQFYSSIIIAFLTRERLFEKGLIGCIVNKNGKND